MNTQSEILINERLKRVEDAIALRVPDRVPFFPQTNLLAVKYGSISVKEAFYDYEKWFLACRKMNMELEPDLCWQPLAANPGRVYDILDCTQIHWPGHGVPENSGIQYADKEYMTINEYDQFIDDPTEYILGVYMPRVFGALAPISALPSLKSLFYHGYRAGLTFSVFSETEIVEAFNRLSQAIVESQRFTAYLAEYEKSLKELGLMSGFSGLTLTCPFDILGDYYRGIRGIMTDMYRQPKKLIAAMDKLQPMLRQRARDISKIGGNTRIFMPLHLGAESFMSPAQFEKFYWPYLKDLIIYLIDEGLTPCPFFEGDYTSRLQYLKELPRGKVMGMFDKTDLSKAKEIIGDTMCIVGNMPIPLLKHGTHDQIREYSKSLIDIVGRDGGFIMSSRSVLDDADKDLVKFWGEFTKEYGTYP